MPHANPDDIVRLLAALRASDYQHSKQAQWPPGTPPRPPVPFITISRQAGAGGRSLATQLAQRLNDRDPAAVPWTVWDNELVERVARDYNLPAARVAALEDVRPSWLEEALGSLVVSAPPVGEMKVFARVAATIRALVAIGRVVIVGRGAAFITADQPGGVHVRLVAPLDRRIDWSAHARGISPDTAEEWIRQTDAARKAYYHRHFPGRPLIPENFTATYNSAAASVDQIAQSILALVPLPTAAVTASPPAVVAVNAASPP